MAQNHWKTQFTVVIVVCRPAGSTAGNGKRTLNLLFWFYVRQVVDGQPERVSKGFSVRKGNPFAGTVKILVNGAFADGGLGHPTTTGPTLPLQDRSYDRLPSAARASTSDSADLRVVPVDKAAATGRRLTRASTIQLLLHRAGIA